MGNLSRYRVEFDNRGRRIAAEVREIESQLKAVAAELYNAVQDAVPQVHTDEEVACAVSAAMGFPTDDVDWAFRIIDGDADSMKWYAWAQDMKKVSSEMPAVLFTVYREGEENGDVERGYFYNGRCEIVSPVVTWPTVTLGEDGKLVVTQPLQQVNQ